MNMKTSSHSDVSTALSYANRESSNLHVSIVPLGMKAPIIQQWLRMICGMRRKSLEEVKTVRLESILKHH